MIIADHRSHRRENILIRPVPSRSAEDALSMSIHSLELGCRT